MDDNVGIFFNTLEKLGAEFNVFIGNHRTEKRETYYQGELCRYYIGLYDKDWRIVSEIYVDSDDINRRNPKRLAFMIFWHLMTEKANKIFDKLITEGSNNEIQKETSDD